MQRSMHSFSGIGGALIAEALWAKADPYLMCWRAFSPVERKG